jgi:DNA-binding NtrC family response regulator
MKTQFATVPINEVPGFESPDGSEFDRPMILVVDDDPMITGTLGAILKHMGYAVITAHDGFEALEFASLVPPDVLVTDQLMPGMDGVELGLAVRSVAPGCEVIVSSGKYIGAERFLQASHSGMDFVTLSKPVHPARMLACIAELLAAKGVRSSVMDLPGSDLPGLISCSDPNCCRGNC